MTTAAHLQGGDAGEFALIAHTGGYAHPPGYPLYSMYLQLARFIPFTSAAHAASVATAVLGAISVALTYIAARCWRRSRLTSVLAAVCFGLAGDIWLFHTLPEVFALNHLCAASLVALSAPTISVSPRLRATALSAIFGLGLSNHLTIVFLLPVLGFGLAQAFGEDLEDTRPGSNAIVVSPKLGAWSLAAAIAGLLPYLYPLAGSHQGAWHWGDVDSATKLFELFTRSDYGIATMAPGESAGPPVELLSFWVSSSFSDLFVLFPLAASGTLAFAGWKLTTSLNQEASGKDQFMVYGLACIGASLLLAGPIFGMMLSGQTDGLNARILRRMHLLSEWLLVFVGTFGVDALREHLAPKLQGFLAAAIVAAMGPVGWIHVAAHHTDTVENYILDTRDAIPENAIVLGTGDHRFFGHLFADRVLHHRRDVTYVDAYLTAYQWYRQRLTERLNVEVPGPESPDGDISLPNLVRRLSSTNRQVCLTHPFHSSLTDRFQWIPTGTALCRVSGGRAETPKSTYRRQVDWLDSARNFPPPSPAVPSWSAEVLGQYARNWQILARALRQTKQPRRADRATEIADAFSAATRLPKQPQ